MERERGKKSARAFIHSGPRVVHSGPGPRYEKLKYKRT
jgi:hypothetical protein